MSYLKLTSFALGIAVVSILSVQSNVVVKAHDIGLAVWLNSGAEGDGASDWRPDVATNGDGVWMAVWDSSGGLGADIDILFSRSEDDGHTWSAATPIDPNAGSDEGDDLEARLEWDGSGTWMVVWSAEEHQQTGPDRDIYFARSTDDGIVWSTPQPLNSEAVSDSGDDMTPQVAGDGNGNWVAVWHSSEAMGSIGDDTDILVATSNDDGMTWSQQAVLNSNAASDSQRDQWAEIMTDGDGNWVAGWETLTQLEPGEYPDNDIVFSRSTDNGATWTPFAPIHDEMLGDVSQDHNVQFAVDGGDLWVAVWHGERPQGSITDRDIIFSLSNNAGASWSAPEYVRADALTDTFEENQPQIATDGRGNWVVVSDAWDPSVSPDESKYDVAVALSTDDALTWHPVEWASEVAPTYVAQHRHPEIATNSLGNWVIVWDSDEDIGGQIGSDRDILYVNCLPFDIDDDGTNQCEDLDDDGDLVADLAESRCGADGMDGTERPERVDAEFAAVDDDGDGSIDELLPAGSEDYDCDGDGYSGSVEAHVFGALNADQDPCGVDAWPADLVSGGIPDSTDRVNIADIVSFLAPTRRIDTSAEDAGFSVRWDLAPGAGLFSEVINIEDLVSLIIVGPPMLGGVAANAGPPCPWPS